MSKNVIRVDSLQPDTKEKRNNNSKIVATAVAGLAILGAGLYAGSRTNSREKGQPTEIVNDATGVTRFAVEGTNANGILLVGYGYDKEKTSPEVAKAYASVAKKLTQGKAEYADAVVTIEDPSGGINEAIYRPLVGGVDSGEIIGDKTARPVFFSALVSSVGTVTLQEIGDIDTENLHVYTSGDARYGEAGLAHKGPGLIDMNIGGKTLPSELVGITEQQVIEQRGGYLDAADPITGQSYAVGAVLVGGMK